jgi:hypothetical protein
LNQGIAGAAKTVTNSLEMNFYAPVGTANFHGIAIGGTSGTHAAIAHNALYGAQEAVQNYSDSTNNVIFVSLQSALGQGGLFSDNAGCPFTSTGDIVAYDPASGVDTGSFGALFLSGVDVTPCPVIRHMTVVGSARGDGGYGLDFGETPFADANVLVADSILYKPDGWGINSQAGSTYLTTCTGGVGICNNDVFGAGITPYVNGGTNFGTHPSATYGDIAIDPGFLTAIRTFPACDSILGGTGSIANMFGTVMFNRWTGAAPLYTSSQVVDCLRAAWVPSNAALLTASSTGSYIGAMVPVVATSPFSTSIAGSVSYSGAVILQ